MDRTPQLAIVIPAYDEAEALPRVVQEIPRERSPRIVVVDNASRDGTGAVARRLGLEVVEEPERGYGRACQRGLRELSGRPPDIVVILDGDYSDYPADLEELLRPILEDRADLVLGSRVQRAARGALPIQVRWGNALATQLIHLLFGHRYADMGPFRAIRWAALQQLDMRDGAFGWNAEMQVKALQHGLRVQEVTVGYRPRIGPSKISGTLRGVLGAGHGIIATILYLRFAPRRYARRVVAMP